MLNKCLHCRLCLRLEEARASEQAVEMEEEFRKLTLQIIGEAFLSLPPEECDRVPPLSPLTILTARVDFMNACRRETAYVSTYPAICDHQ